ncbi:hypothetical protein EDD18DRAFT_1112662 [Armillaria luteobubalina]|uniref:Uncharacterized protein n=1 Tax=Armillaria luteobubalina TaxID=153913 RepID=A0AA39PDD0_9AGAR|nr:hypothetical protein EDD18DRAFT_1112662 [Armillaria luteobubalina]
MDEFYNVAKAKDTIQALLEESVKTNKYHLSRIIKEGTQMMNVSLQKDDDNFVWHLVKGVAEESEELVFVCMGVISFDEAIATLQEIRLTGEREFKNGMLDKWTPSTYRGFPAFTVSNQYFRMAKEGGQYEAITFDKDIDPVGILQQLAKTDVAHTEDNEVQYFKANVDDEGKWRCMWTVAAIWRKTANPRTTGINEPDPNCSGLAMSSRFNALSSYLKQEDAKRMLSKCSAPEETGPKQLKRKIGFTDEDSCDDMATKRAKEGQTMDELA